MNSKLKLSVYGSSGFIGKKFSNISQHECIPIDREERKPESKEIVYFISTTHNYHVFDDLKIDINTNLLVLMEMLETLKGDEKVVVNFISSWFAYGETPLPASEKMCCKPKGFYSITKHTAESMLISFCETYKIKYRILRLSNVYGSEDKSVSAKKNALQYLIDKMKENEPIDLYHGGNFYRDYLHVDDICRAIDLCVTKGPLNEIINIGSGQKIKFKEVINIAKEELDSESKIGVMEPPEFHKTIQVKDFYMDVSKLKKMGFVPKISIKKGVKELCHR